MTNRKIPATPEQLMNPAPPIPHDDSGARRVKKERIVREKKNYCNADGECKAEGDYDMCKYCADCTCHHGCEKCKHSAFDECYCDKARKEAGVV